MEKGISSNGDVDDVLMMITELLKSFENDKHEKDDEDNPSVKIDKECRKEVEKNTYENLGSIMTMKDAVAKLEEMHPEAVLDEGEEIIWEFPETPEEKKLREELIEDLEANILIESVMRVAEAKQKEKELAEAKFLIKKKEEELEELKKKIRNDT